MLENLKPAEKIEPSPFGRPGVTFDGNQGEATTPYLASDKDFTDFLIEAGYSPDHYEVVGNPRTSKWQQREGGDWLTSYRFTFRIKQDTLDLPLLYAEAKKGIKKPTKTLQLTKTNKAMVILWSDLQVGKVDQLQASCRLVSEVQLACCLVSLVEVVSCPLVGFFDDAASYKFHLGHTIAHTIMFLPLGDFARCPVSMTRPSSTSSARLDRIPLSLALGASLRWTSIL